MEKMWNVYLIHHSHTDIGYTERQEKIMRYHYDFIRQAIEILDDIHSGKTTGCDGFVWQCENHWQIENFYQMADEELKKKFDEGATITFVLGELKKTDLLGVELAILSPGIPTDAPFVEMIRETGIPIWGEMQLAYRPFAQ